MVSSDDCMQKSSTAPATTSRPSSPPSANPSKEIMEDMHDDTLVESNNENVTDNMNIVEDEMLGGDGAIVPEVVHSHHCIANRSCSAIGMLNTDLAVMLEIVATSSVQGTIVEQRHELMVSPTGGIPTWRKAHFIKPSVSSIDGPPMKLPSLSPMPIWPLEVVFSGWMDPIKKWKTWKNGVLRLTPLFSHGVRQLLHWRICRFWVVFQFWAVLLSPGTS
ncbi:unnamed protein product [Fraxinus pennsylvanica]|uniref:Uncharacterized protein n=1 Tax=Fraxinus pennsylvanica TaxID=56036 RepID=A0AAD1Z4U5_9LAMI|nr:unnamed protein product [Fraxinus pennsylvanica]